MIDQPTDHVLNRPMTDDERIKAITDVVMEWFNDLISDLDYHGDGLMDEEQKIVLQILCDGEECSEDHINDLATKLVKEGTL